MNDTDDIPIKIDMKLDSKDAASTIDKLVTTISAPFSRWSKNREPISMAKAESQATIIRARAAKPLSDALGISEKDAASLLMRTEQRELYEKIRHQQNIEDIANGAAPHIRSTQPEKIVEVEWTMEFFEQCKNVGNEHLQKLWSKILAGEISNPGKYSKRTLSFIRTLSQQEALAFTNFCSLVWFEHYLGNFCLNPTDQPGLDEFGVSYNDLIELDSMGLIRFDNDFTGFTLGSKEIINFVYFNETLTFKVPANIKEIRIPIILLTRLGRELMEITGAKINQSYKEALLIKLKKIGLNQITDTAAKDLDYLDIPGFLRRQAD